MFLSKKIVAISRRYIIFDLSSSIDQDVVELEALLAQNLGMIRNDESIRVIAVEYPLRLYTKIALIEKYVMLMSKKTTINIHPVS